MQYKVTPSADGATVEFTAVGVGQAAWDFGDGTPLVTGLRVTHKYAPGSYDATMRVGDSSYVQHFDIVAQGKVEAAQVGPSLGLLAVIAGIFVLAATAAVVIVLRKTGKTGK